MKEPSTRKIVIAALTGVLLLGVIVLLLVITPGKQRSTGTETQNDIAEIAEPKDIQDNHTTAAQENVPDPMQEDSATAQNSEDAAQKPLSEESGFLKVEVRMDNSWESGTGKSYQYAIKITNTGTATISGWKVAIDFGTAITMDNSWNGTISVSETGLNISPVDYNNEISAGGSAEVGVIITTNGPVEVQVAVE